MKKLFVFGSLLLGTMVGLTACDEIAEKLDGTTWEYVNEESVTYVLSFESTTFKVNATPEDGETYPFIEGSYEYSTTFVSNTGSITITFLGDVLETPLTGSYVVDFIGKTLDLTYPDLSGETITTTFTQKELEEILPD